MITAAELFFSVRGRIPRRSWWLGFAVLFALSVVLPLLFPLIGLGEQVIRTETWTSTEGSQRIVSKMTFRPSAWGQVLYFLLTAWPTYAVHVKRRHDRGRSGTEVAVYLVVMGVVAGIQLLTSGAANELFGIVGIGSLLFQLYLVVVCGMLAGDIAPNEYGPSPLRTALAAS
jgi:uncharacterized membrane protein YhaH (DUF805 family)